MKILIAHNVYNDVKNYCAVLDYYNYIWELYHPEINPKDFDCLLLPGGYDVDPSLYGQIPDKSVTVFNKSFDLMQLSLLDHFVKMKKPVIGICKGLQIINTYFKGTLIQDIKTNIAHNNPDFSDRYHSVINNDYMLDLYGKTATVNSQHHQSIDKIGNGLIAVSHSDDNIIEAIRHNTLPIYAVQWHPERTVLNFQREGVVDGFKFFDYFFEKAEKISE
ncbi:MAG: gamma-glutamyl-gamma-aminobutyrate hydrolase family protein [Erysipelotrichia bacterium]|nr:gamma-glutamyl-gamma-aminobutyrate hydrolase family protein [Erysipelotrichia bacterium]